MLLEVWQDLKFLEQSLDSSRLRLRKKIILKMSHLLVVTILTTAAPVITVKAKAASG